MFHECKVYDGGGKLKATYTSDQMSQHHWDGMGDSASQFVIEGAEISPLVLCPSEPLIANTKSSVNTKNKINALFFITPWPWPLFYPSQY